MKGDDKFMKLAERTGRHIPKRAEVYARKEDIQQLFLHLLERNAAEEEEELFVNAKCFLREVIETILTSEEYQSYKIGKKEYLNTLEQKQTELESLAAERLLQEEDVRQLYAILLKREAQKVETDSWVKEKITLREFLNRVCNSDEYLLLQDKQKRKEERDTQKILELENARQVAEQKAEQYAVELKCTQSDVETLFFSILHRNASDQEKSLFVANQMSVRELIQAVLSSEEYHIYNLPEEKKCADTADIQDLYQLILGREPSENEVQLYFNHHATKADILQSLADSDELKKHLESAKRSKKMKKYDTDLVLKSDLIEAILGRPMRNYEIQIFGKQKIGDFVEDLLKSSEREHFEDVFMVDHVYEDKYGAVTYNVKWEEPAMFTCIYNGMFKDIITTELRKGRPGVWREQYEFLRFFPGEGTFIDIGANIGVLSCLYCSKGWNGYAIEASERNVMCIKKSKNFNNLKLEIGEFAVSDKTQVLRFLENGPWGTVENAISDCVSEIQDIAYDDFTYREVQAYALDEWEMTNLTVPERVTYIKMDIEGSEIAALRGMKKFLKRYSFPIIYCESNGESLFHFGYTTEDLRKEFMDLGYHRYRWIDDTLILCDEVQFQLNYCMDFLYIHDMPDFLSGFVTGEKKKAVRADEIVELLKSDIFGEQVHACSELRNFRKYLSDKEIVRILQEYKNGRNQVLKEALGWFDSEGSIAELCI